MTIMIALEGTTRLHHGCVAGLVLLRRRLRSLQNLGKKKWTEGLTVTPHTAAAASTTASLETLASLSEAYAKRVADEDTKAASELAVAYVGKASCSGPWWP